MHPLTNSWCPFLFLKNIILPLFFTKWINKQKRVFLMNGPRAGCKFFSFSLFQIRFVCFLFFTSSAKSHLGKSHLQKSHVEKRGGQWIFSENWAPLNARLWGMRKEGGFEKTRFLSARNPNVHTVHCSLCISPQCNTLHNMQLGVQCSVLSIAHYFALLSPCADMSTVHSIERCSGVE